MSDNVTVRGNGVGPPALLTLLFVFLKLNPGGNFDTGVVNWSWWWVLSPLWISFLLFIVTLLFMGVVAVIAGVFQTRNHKRKAAAFRARRNFPRY